MNRVARRRLTGRNLCVAVALLAGPTACSDSPAGPSGPDPNPDPDPVAYDHRLGTGASAADLLSAEDYDSLVIEVQYVEGHRPTDAGLGALTDFLTARLDKPRGISVQLESIPVAPQATWSVSQVVSLEQQHRTVFTDGRTLALYFLFLDGEYADNANVLGFAYYNTSMAIFEEKIADNSGGVLGPSAATVEGVVLKHEAGHNMGLVANGSPMQTEHQDEPNGKHCDDPDCLMYWSVRTLDFISSLTGDGPELDQNCLDDLRANGGL